jgi:hypothetical protein
MMRYNLLAAAVALTLLAGCSSFGKKNDVSQGGMINPGAQQAISEQRVVNDFKRQGIRVIYSLTGDLEAIESTGYAPVWGNSQNAIRESYRVAEVEAKKAMNDFINRETITSSVSVSMISRNLERAQDNKNNSFSSNTTGRDDVVSEVTDEEMMSEGTGSGRQENRASRQDALNIASRVNTNISIRNTGILGGMYLVEGSVINNGRNVRAVYRWDRKHNAVRGNVRNLMMQ